MKWSDIGGAVSKVAPMIAGAAGGPLAASAVTAIEGALGVNKPQAATLDQRKDAVAAAFSSDPDALLKIKQAEQDFELKMKQLGFEDTEDLYKLAVEDRESARSMQIQTKDVTPRILAGGVTIGFFGILIFMLFRAIPDSSKDILDIMLGSLGTAWISIIAFYFGSSNDSETKTHLLAAKK